MTVHSSQHQFTAVNVSSLQSMLVCWGRRTNIYRKLAAFIVSCLLMVLVKTGSPYSQIYSFWGNGAVDRTFKTQPLALKNKVQLNPNTGLLLHIITTTQCWCCQAEKTLHSGLRRCEVRFLDQTATTHSPLSGAAGWFMQYFIHPERKCGQLRI